MTKIRNNIQVNEIRRFWIYNIYSATKNDILFTKWKWFSLEYMLIVLQKREKYWNNTPKKSNWRPDRCAKKVHPNEITHFNIHEWS